MATTDLNQHRQGLRPNRTTRASTGNAHVYTVHQKISANIVTHVHRN